MIAIAGVLLALAGTVAACFSLYLTGLAVAALVPRRLAATGAAPTSRLVVLVPAHDEESLIARCVKSLLAQTYPGHLFRVIVIADNCTDRTASIALQAGAEVLTRNAPEARGKGQALRWAMDQVLNADTTVDAVVVVDADSIAAPGMLTAMECQLAAGHPVVQADYRLVEDSSSPRSTMIAAGFLLFHRVRFAGRDRLGMAANLVGNGMLFGRAVLEKHPWDAFTGVEDLEYSIRLRLAGIKPKFARDAIVCGPGPATRSGVLRQRLRWEGGRFHVIRRWLGPLAAARKFDAALDLATPPLGLLVILTVAGGFATTLAVLARIAPSWTLAPWLVALVAIPSFVLIGLGAAGSPALAARVMIGAPRFVAWKLATYLRLARGFDASRWERSDRTVPARRVEIAGVPVDTVDMSGALDRLRTAIQGDRLFQVATINLDFEVRAQDDLRVRGIFERRDRNLADGAPVVWLGRLLGAEIPARVAGADLVPALLAESARTGARVFLLGGEGGVAEAAAMRYYELYPGLQIAGTFEPPRASVDQMDNDEILARIEAAHADVLLVAFGNPKQEQWIDLHRDRLHVKVAIGVGCVLDLVAGRSRRAPRWMQDAGLEWLYRLSREPRRLFGRYLKDAIWLVPLAAHTVRARMASGALAEAA